MKRPDLEELRGQYGVLRSLAATHVCQVAEYGLALEGQLAEASRSLTSAVAALDEARRLLERTEMMTSALRAVADEAEQTMAVSAPTMEMVYFALGGMR